MVSGLGKGIAAASIGALLETRGLSISLMKLDPYINVDAGTMNPFQHGEVFVTEDGAETDLDLGHYERFSSAVLGRKHNVEIGGTVGDIESLPFLEAIRQYRHDHGRENSLFVHLTLIVETTEMKTKPTQHSVGKLREIGIQPDILICRTSNSLSDHLRRKISLFTNVQEDAVVDGLDVESVYEAPLMFQQQGLDNTIANYLKMWTRRPMLQPWIELVNRLKNPKDAVDIAFVGKYVQQRDSYESLNEALMHGGIANQLKPRLHYIDSEMLETEKIEDLLSGMDGILVAPGFGERGMEGKIAAVEFARTRNIPFFGICLGLQMAIVECARNLGGIKDAHSAEFRPDHKNNVVDLMPSQAGLQETGGSMRLGSYPAQLQKGSKIASIYQSTDIWFIACQFHPELKSKPLLPHPLFASYIQAAYEFRKFRLGQERRQVEKARTSHG